MLLCCQKLEEKEIMSITLPQLGVLIRFQKRELMNSDSWAVPRNATDLSGHKQCNMRKRSQIYSQGRGGETERVAEPTSAFRGVFPPFHPWDVAFLDTTENKAGFGADFYRFLKFHHQKTSK